MSAYVIAEVDVLDQEGYAEYRAKVPAVIAACGGRYLARGGAVEMLEGDQAVNRVVIIEFADMAALKAFWSSPEYRPLQAIRERTATSRIMAVEGVKI